MKTSIEWTHPPGYRGFSWNPVRGCSIVSPGCRECYAMKMAARFSGPGQWGEGVAERANGKARWTGKVELVEKMLPIPLRARIPTCWFVNSTSDLFHEKLPDEAIDRVFAMMALCPEHRFLVLTKRAERMRAYMNASKRKWAATTAVWNRETHPAMTELGKVIMRRQHPRSDLWHVPDWPLKNVGLGVSVETQKYADERIPLLLDTPATMRFVSAEPLLGPLDLRAYLCICAHCASGARCGAGLDWLIPGGESGTHARPMHPDWPRKIRDDCEWSGARLFFKQWGAWVPTAQNQWVDGPTFRMFPDTGEAIEWRDFELGPWSDDDAEEIVRVGKKAAGNLLDGVEHREFPEWFGTEKQGQGEGQGQGTSNV